MSFRVQGHERPLLHHALHEHRKFLGRARTPVDAIWLGVISHILNPILEHTTYSRHCKLPLAGVHLRRPAPSSHATAPMNLMSGCATWCKRAKSMPVQAVRLLSRTCAQLAHRAARW